MLRLDYGEFPTVFIGDYHMAMKAYNSDAFNDRPFPHMPGYKMMRGEETTGTIPGVGLSHGKQW